MKVYGHQITPEQEAACLAAMKGRFDKYGISGALERSGIPHKVGEGGLRHIFLAYRVADRLIERERKAGRIRWLSKERCWERVALKATTNLYLTGVATIRTDGPQRQAELET